MKSDFDARYRALTLPILSTGYTVWLPNENIEASVIEKVGLIAYRVAIPKGTSQRNRSQIRAMLQIETYYQRIRILKKSDQSLTKMTILLTQMKG